MEHKPFCDKVEPEYVFKPGDRYTINGKQYLLSHVAPGRYALIGLVTGWNWSDHCTKLNVDGFKVLLGTRVGSWQEIYKTRVPAGGKQ